MSAYEKLLKNLKDSEARPDEEVTQDDKKVKIVEVKKPGSYKFRLFPDKEDPEDVPYLKVFIHLGFVHPNYGKKVPLLCKGKDCPMCAVAKRLKNEKHADAWMYKSNQRFIYYAIDENDTVVLLSLGYYAHEEVKKKIIAQLKASINVMDMMDGRWMELMITVVDEKWKYLCSVDSESHRMPQKARDVFSKQKDLSKIYQDRPLEELKKIVKGEKTEMKGKSQSNSQNTNRPAERKTEKNSPENMKFDSDVVDKLEGETEEAAKEDSDSNMKRLDDIMNESEDDFN